MTSKIRLHIVVLGVIIVFLLTLFAFVGFVRAEIHDDSVPTNTVDTRAGLRDLAEEKRIELREKADVLRSDAEVRKAELGVQRDELRSNAEVRKAELEARREEALEKARMRREEAAEKREERKQKLDEKRKGRIAAYSERIVKRMNAAVDRLEKIVDRVGSRIVKLEDKFDGLSLEESKSLLAIARVELLNASVNIEDIALALQAALDSDTPKEAFEEVRVLFGEAKQSIKDAHKTLVDAIKSVKAANSLRMDEASADGEDNSTEDTEGGDSE